MLFIKCFIRDCFGRYVILCNFFCQGIGLCVVVGVIVVMFRFLCLVKFWCKVFKSLYMDISKIIEKGNVFVIVIVCSVFSFLVRRSVIVIMFMSEV